MNKTIYKWTLCLFALITIASCSNSEDDIFDESSANRLTGAAKDYHEYLCSAPNGWAMEYFASTEEAGNTFLMKFDANGAVKIAAKNTWIDNKYSEESSLWRMLVDNGPVLSFSTYNNLFHMFSDPGDIPGTDADESGSGHYGDYEFVVLSKTENEIFLKGKKHGVRVTMRKLAVDQDWEGYYAKLDASDKAMFSRKVPTLVLNANGEKYTITNAVNHVFNFVPEGGDPITQTTAVPFIILENGIRLVKPFKGDNDAFEVQNFVLTEAGLACADDNQSTITAFNPATLIQSSGFVWRMDKAQLGGKFVTAYDAVVSQSKSVFNTVFTYFEFRFDAKAGKNALYFKNGKYTGMIYIKDTTLAEDGSLIKFESDYTGDNNGQVHLDKIPAYKEFVDLLTAGDYKIEADSKLNPTKLTVTSVSNPQDSFVVNIQ